MGKITIFGGPDSVPSARLSARANPTDFGIAGQAAARASGALTGLGAALTLRQQQAARADRMIGAVLGAARDIFDLQSGLPQDSGTQDSGPQGSGSQDSGPQNFGPGSLPARFESQAGALRDNYANLLGGDPAMQQDFAAAVTPLIERGRVEALRQSATAQNALYRDRLDSGLADLASRVAAAPDGLTRDLLGRQAAPAIRAARDAGILSDSEAATYARRFQMGVDGAQAEAAIANDPAHAVSLFSDPQNFPSLDRASRASYLARAEARAKAAPADRVAAEDSAQHDIIAAAEEQRTRTAAGLMAAIDAGSGKLADIEEAAAMGRIAAPDRDALAAALERKRAGDAQAASDYLRVGAVLSGLGPALDSGDPADRRAVDTYYARILAPTLGDAGGSGASANGTSPNRNGQPVAGSSDGLAAMVSGSGATGADAALTQIAEFAGRTGIVPSAPLMRAQAELRYGQSEDQARAARFFDALPESVRSQAAPEDIARASLVARGLDAGLPPDLAVRAAGEASQSEARRQETLLPSGLPTGEMPAQNVAQSGAPTGPAPSNDNQQLAQRPESIDSVIERTKQAETLRQSIYDKLSWGRTDAARQKARKEAQDYLKDPQPGTVFKMMESRIWAIRNHMPARFNIADDPSKLGEPPIYRNNRYGREVVNTYNSEITKEAQRQGVDPNLVRAIMYFENADGWYGVLPEEFGASATILPMNINPRIWEDISGVPRVDFSKPAANIRAGVALIKQISEHLPPEDRTPAKIGTLWNNISKEDVSDEEARIQRIFDTKPWKTEN